jgi:hypothetical protein
MLAVNVVMINGRMIGCTVSDRWNLEAAGIPAVCDARRARETMAAMGLVLRIRKTASVVTAPSKTERAALTPSLLGGLTRSLKRAMGA